MFTCIDYTFIDYIEKLCEIILKDCVNQTKLPSPSIKAKPLQFIKTKNKAPAGRYTYVSFLQICSKIFERLMYDSILAFLIQIGAAI